MTREEAIKGLKVLRKDFSGYKPNEEMFDMAIEALSAEPCAQPFTSEQIQTMQELEAAQVEKAYELGKADRPKWIPVSERLPEEGDVVLICSKIGVIDFGKRKGDKWVWLAEALWDYWQETEDLIAWMPLPEAYKESDADGSD